MPLSDAVEWFDGPDSDDDVIILAGRIQERREQAAPFIPTNWMRAHWTVKCLWYLCALVALSWAGSFGLFAILALIPPLTPLGLVMLPIAGMPMAQLIRWRTKTAKVPFSSLPTPPNS